LVWYADDFVLLATVVMSAILVWRHQGNIAKLMRGEESRIGGRKLGSDSN
jgi:glycerol-3-phosphate acyltransferase PlsY